MARTLSNVNRQFVMATRPFGLPKESDFAIREVPLPVPAEGEMLIRAYYLSADPLQRDRMEATSSYGKVLEDGGVIVGRLVGKIMESRNSDFKVGEFGAHAAHHTESQQFNPRSPTLSRRTGNNPG